MHHDRQSALAFAETLKAGLGGALTKADVAVYPAYPYLLPLAEALASTGVWVGAQEMHEAEKGAFTGAVSASMVLDAGGTSVLIGHSERRQLFGETDEGTRRKVAAALKAGLKPVLCVGETLPQREAGETERVVLSQLEGGLEGVDDPGPLVLAYEPVWAIGTGKTATPDQAQEVHGVIRKWWAKRFGADAAGVRILYGGSVKPGNVSALMAQEDVNGGLVGGASLEAGSFLDIVRNAVEMG
jgi:triosephosphate isomerase